VPGVHLLFVRDSGPWFAPPQSDQHGTTVAVGPLDSRDVGLGAGRGWVSQHQSAQVRHDLVIS
jgi:hypothetical protein